MRVLECHRLLLDLGWKPYGSAADSRYFKKNAIKLSARVSTIEDQPGKTFISYDTELLSADIPMPTDYEDPRYYDGQKRVRFDYRTVISGSHGADLTTMTEFYRGQLAESGWEEKADGTKTTEKTASMSFDNDGTALLVDLRTVDAATEFVIASRNVERAMKDEVVPEAGQAKVVFGNATEADIVIVISDTEHKIDVGVGRDGPANAKKIDIKPGKHTIVIKVPNENPQTEEVDVKPGTTWGIVAFGDEGYLADRIY